MSDEEARACCTFLNAVAGGVKGGALGPAFLVQFQLMTRNLLDSGGYNLVTQEIYGFEKKG